MKIIKVILLVVLLVKEYKNKLTHTLEKANITNEDTNPMHAKIQKASYTLKFFNDGELIKKLNFEAASKSTQALIYF